MKGLPFILPFPLVTAMIRKKKILVSEDDAGILDVLRLMLEDENYEVEISRDGKKIYQLDNELPDLILLDIWMSGVDGRDLCRYLKNNDKTKNIPVIILSANKDTEQIAKEVGADGFLQKPFDMEELLAKLHEHLSS